jgi:tetratricopeptide (TPR) repeat protein
MCCIFSNAQSVSFLFKGNISNNDVKKVESGVTIAIVQDGSTISSATSGTDGKYTLKGMVNYKKPFSVVFTKSGMVSQRVNFNYVNLIEEDLPAGADYQPLPSLNVALFAEVPGGDFSFLNTEPVEIYTWNPVKASPDLDANAKAKTTAKITNAINSAKANSANNEANYNAAIAAANSLRDQKKYEEAMFKYEEALGFKQNDKYATEQIDLMDQLNQKAKTEALVDQQENQVYYDLIKAADALRDQKKFEQAIAKYNEASALRNEDYPKQQASELQKTVEYNQLITQADMFYNQKSWKAAKEKYTLAKNLKPAEQHPKTRLADIETKMAAQTAEKEKKQKYDDAIAAADILFAEGKFVDAKSKYNEALQFESSATYPTERMSECDVKIAEAAKEQERLAQIQKLLTEGKVIFDQSKWNEAKAKYEGVISLDENNAEAKSKLDAIAVKLAEVADAAAKETKFIKLVGEGDQAVKVTKLEEAKAKYEEAIDLKKDVAVQTKLDNVNKQIADAAQKLKLENEFQQLKAEGLQLAADQKWSDAKVKLNAALGIHSDVLVSQKLKEVEEAEKRDAALSQNESDYQKLLTEAKAFEAVNKWDEAIAKYNDAQQKKPSEQEPKEKISELQKLKLNKAKQDEIDAQYAEFMRKGNELMAQKNYLAAIKEYNNANGLKPNEKEPVEKADVAEGLAKGDEDEKNKIFENILAAAQTKINEKDFEGARQYIERATKANPDDKRPEELLKQVQQIEEIERNYSTKLKEAEQFASAGNFTKAIAAFEQAKQIKPLETTPQTRIDELTKEQNDAANAAQINLLYQDYMTKGQNSLTTENYEQALMHYQNALSVKKDDQIALEQVKKVQQILDDIANSLKNEVDRKNKFDELVRSGDTHADNKDFSAAVKSYEEALLIDANNSLVRVKLEKAKLSGIEQIAKEEEQAYKQIIKEGDDFFNTKSYDKARASYELAKSKRPNDTYPASKLAEIDAILNPVIVEIGSLEDLGEPFDISVMDGVAALQKAELDRRNMKTDNIQDKIDDIQDNESELTQAKIEENNTSINTIYEIQRSMEVIDEGRDLPRQESLASIEEIEKSQAEDDIDNTKFNSAEHQFSQEKIELIEKESALDYTLRDDAKKESTAIIDDVMTSAENEFSDLETKENEKNDESNSEFSRIEKQRDMNAKENEGARQETDLAIEKTMVFAATESELIGQEYIVRNSETQSELDKANLLIGVNAENDAKLAPENGLALIAIEDDILLVETASSKKAENHTKEIAEQVVKVNEMISEADEFRELDHQESITKMEEALTEVEDAQFEEFLNENEKYLKNKKEISKINENLTEGEENAEERRTESLSKMNELEQNSSTMNDIAIESDDLQRQRTSERINVMDQSSAENAEATAQRQENNTDKINNVVIAADLKSNNRDQEQKEKAQSTQEQLNNIESTQPVKVHSANSLGNEYPEGVSQETFKQNDEYGLLVAIVTRRVVVINGEGNVYVRTQTNYNTTYSKNGQPTTEYVWQRETQGGNLKKNY